ncbi:hypothetical protein GF342_01000 [Candidatus Woesearchaeota archaeon]|nr:hypothetical protein [Candidatus Woesearchaeota archaeon]
MVTLVWFIPTILALAVWQVVWKGFGLWHAARNKQLPWFMVILIFNTVGILSIVYLKFFQKKR